MRAPAVLLALLCVSAAVIGEDASRNAAREAAADAKRLAEQLASKDEAQVLAAVQAASAMQHKSLVAPLTRLLKAKSAAVRTAAIAALGKRTDRAGKKRAARALASRLRPLSARKTEDAAAEVKSVAQALHDLAEESSIKALLDVKAGDDPEVVRARARAAANVPSKKAIDQLLGLWAKKQGGQGHKGAVQQALRYATGQKIRGNLREWQKWWRDNRATFDVIEAFEARRSGAQERAQKKNRKRGKRAKKAGDA